MMLRTGLVRGSRVLEHGLRPSLRGQWQVQRPRLALKRGYADQNTVAGVPTGPISAGREAPTTINPPPSAPSSPAASTTSSQPPPKKPRRRLRRLFLSLLFLSVFGYAGGVYYSLINDNFHDFFTQYVPFGEDAVGYFEEREFKKRFPARESSTNSPLTAQPRGEGKVTIGRSSGHRPKVAESQNKGNDLGLRGRHASALEDNKDPPLHDSKPPESSKKDDTKKSDDDSKGEDTRAASQKKEAEVKGEDAKKEQTQDSKKEAKPTEAKPAEAKPVEAKKEEAKPAPAPKLAPPPAEPIKQIDHLNVPEASEAVVQDLVNLLNGIITAVNSAADSGKYTQIIGTAKDELHKVISNVTTLKEQAQSYADAQIRNAHSEFDTAAKELVRRLEREMKDQEVKWRDEYEAERERISESYQQKLSAELDVARKVAEMKEENSLVQQEIELQKKFMSQVQESVETEREGRLSKLDSLSDGVKDLETLSAQARAVLEAALQTQHLQVALEAVRARIASSDTLAQPAPFLNELVALKEVSNNDSLVDAAIATINPTAYQRGIPSPAHLIDRFRRVAAEVRKAALLPEDAGVASHAASAVLSRLMFDKKRSVENGGGLPEGADVEAVLARTEVLLEEGDLDAAAREMNGLKGWAGVLSKDWVNSCRRVLEVRQAIEVIATEARLQSLLVD